MNQIKMPKVSVIIPTYNRAYFICDAIDSVLAQTFKDFEIIVVDDGSTDNTKQILSKYGSAVRYIYQHNQGRSQARNTGIKAAKGEYIAFLDDDDLWLTEKLQKQVAYLDAHSDIGLVHTLTEVVDEYGQPLQKETKKRLKLYRQAMRSGYTYEGMSRLCAMFTSAVMLRKDCFDNAGFFDAEIPAFEDWDFYLRLVLKYNIATIPEPLVKFRIHKAHSTQNEFIQGRIKVSLKHLVISDSFSDLSLRKRIHYNFYIHLAKAYYIAMDTGKSRDYIIRALRLRPATLLLLNFEFYLLATLFVPKLITKIRAAKALFVSASQGVFPARIIPDETSGGPLTSHLKRYEFMKAFCKGKVVLDAACGVGYGSSYLSDVVKEIVGVDINEETVAYAKAHYLKENIKFQTMDIHNLNLPDKYFDVVCSFETLEHLDNPQKYLAEVKRVLKEGGVFIVSTPQAKKTNFKPKNPYHKVEFSKNDFQRLLEKYFANVRILGQRRRQSAFHRYLQKIDIFHLRAVLSGSLRKKICHAVSTRSWEETGIEDFIISEDNLELAKELIGICS